MAKNKLSIYLVKEKINDKDDIFDKPEEISELQSYPDGSIAYFIPTHVHEPTWMSSFFHQSGNKLLQQANSRVVLLKRLIIDDETRLFALTFGYARFLFKEDVLEEQFGLRIILNSIQQNQIRRISKASVGSNHKQSDEQLPKSSDISEFGFDINRDLMKNISGKSDDEMFEKSMLTGGDIFSLTIERDITNIDEFLVFCYRRYKQTSYKEKFAWIDNIKYIKDKSLIESLNQALIREIKEENFDRVWMAVPEVVAWEDIKDFKIQGDNNYYGDIYIKNVIESLRSDLTDTNQLQNKKIYARSSKDEQNNVYEWSAYKCIVAEIGVNQQQYCLNNGKWYRIDNSFVEEINKQYLSIDLYEAEFVDHTNNTDEDTYNEQLSRCLPGSYLLHKYKISIGGGQGNNVEPCDLFWNNKLIHIKKNGGSSVLSHLFNQALVSAQAWLDSGFRSQLYEKMQKNNEGICISEPFSASDYEIIIAIINKFSNKRPRIPFFSKVAVCFVAKNIRNLGYRIKLKNIKMIKD